MTDIYEPSWASVIQNVFNEDGTVNEMLVSSSVRRINMLADLNEIFPDQGLILSENHGPKRLYSSKLGGIKKSFPDTAFRHSIILLNNLYEKEYIDLTDEEFMQIETIIENYRIIK